MSGVYKIVHRDSNTTYVGATSLPFHIRWNTHKCDLSSNRAHNAHLQAAWNKYGAAAFDFIILDETTNPFEHEQTWIDMLRMDGIHLYNQNLWVDIPYMLGRTHDDDARQKISVAHTGRKHTAQAKENMRRTSLGNKSRTGQRRSKEERRKTSESLKRAYAEDRHSREKSKEHRKKISQGLRRYHANRSPAD